MPEGGDQPMEGISDNWLHDKMAALPFFKDVVAYILDAIRQSLIVEVDVERLQEYIQFLHRHYQSQPRAFTHVMLDNLASLITCRRTVANSIIARRDTEEVSKSKSKSKTKK